MIDTAPAASASGSAASETPAKTALLQRVRELRHLDQLISLAFWDQETCMPDAASELRGEQLATIEAIRHGRVISNELGEQIDRAAEACRGDADMDALVARLRRVRRQALALPERHVREFAVVRSRCLSSWKAARATEDFPSFAPGFAELIALVRERGAALSLTGDPWDGLIDEHEPGMTRARLTPVLHDLCAELAPMATECARQRAADGEILAGRRFPEAAQWEISRVMLAAIGFDFRRGRIDRSTHPFCMNAGPDDVRVTNRFFEDDPRPAIFGALHEGGHGLYEQGFRPADRDSLLGEATSMGLHESQSRLWENHIGRRRSFWEHWYPRLQGLFPDGLARIDLDSFLRSVTFVSPSFIRVEADEVTYNLHVALRFELEVGLVSGELSVADLPSAWNERMEKFLGIVPPRPSLGCLQDLHWPSGIFGYFPTYSIGNLYAAQLVEKYEEKADLDAELRRGETAPLLAWLRESVQSVGARLPAEEIVIRATGRGLDAAACLRTLRARYLAG